MLAAPVPIPSFDSLLNGLTTVPDRSPVAAGYPQEATNRVTNHLKLRRMLADKRVRVADTLVEGARIKILSLYPGGWNAVV